MLIKTFGRGIGGPAMTVRRHPPRRDDGTNELTFVALDAHARADPNPWLAVRMHSGTPRELKVKIANTIRLGTGEPKIFNDDVTIPSMLSSGIELEDARNYHVVGCVERTCPARIQLARLRAYEYRQSAGARDQRRAML